jgi:hypothetical protein
MEQFGISKKVMWAGIVLILLTGVIHLIDAPSSFDDATYKGILFVANGIAAAVAGLGIYRGARNWGWGLGLLIAGGSLVGYIISRTVGLPGLGPDDWLEPLGIASLIVEAAYIWFALQALSGADVSRRTSVGSLE